MSRKDYREAARIIREASYLSAEARARLVSDLVTFFADDNPRFSPSKFGAACELESACYPQDNPSARLDALEMLSGLAETSEERDMLAGIRERIRNGAEPLASRKAAEPDRVRR